MTRERALLGWVVALLVSTLAACTGGSTPTATAPAPPPTATSASPGASPTPVVELDATSPPPRPSELSEASADGAAAAASYFMSLYPYVLATGDLAEWNAMSADTCDFCTNTRAEVERLQGAGQRSLGGVTVVSASGQDLGGNDWYAARLTVQIDPSSDVDGSGAVVRTNDGGRYDVDFAMTWADRWVIDSAGIVESPTSS